MRRLQQQQNVISNIEVAVRSHNKNSWTENKYRRRKPQSFSGRKQPVVLYGASHVLLKKTKTGEELLSIHDICLVPVFMFQQSLLKNTAVCRAMNTDSSRAAAV